MLKRCMNLIKSRQWAYWNHVQNELCGCPVLQNYAITECMNHGQQTPTILWVSVFLNEITNLSRVYLRASHGRVGYICSHYVHNLGLIILCHPILLINGYCGDLEKKMWENVKMTLVKLNMRQSLLTLQRLEFIPVNSNVVYLSMKN